MDHRNLSGQLYHLKKTDSSATFIFFLSHCGLIFCNQLFCTLIIDCFKYDPENVLQIFVGEIQWF